MGTRSWNQNSTNKYINGESIYVKASYFDSDDDIKYSDYFSYKGETLLEGTILSIHQASLRVKFKIDGTVSSLNMVKSLKY